MFNIAKKKHYTKFFTLKFSKTKKKKIFLNKKILKSKYNEYQKFYIWNKSLSSKL